MKKQAMAAALAALAVIGSTSGARAAGSDAGWYGGIRLGRSVANVGSGDIDNAFSGQGLTTSSSFDRRDWTGSLFGGYRFNRNFALEGGLTRLGSFGYSSTATAPAAGAINGHYAAGGAELDAVGLLPLAERWTLYGKAGLIYADTRLDASASGVSASDMHHWSTEPLLGIGASYDLTRNVAAQVEWDRYSGLGDSSTGSGGINQYTVGLVYRFQ